MPAPNNVHIHERPPHYHAILDLHHTCAIIYIIPRHDLSSLSLCLSLSLSHSLTKLSIHRQSTRGEMEKKPKGQKRAVFEDERFAENGRGRRGIIDR
jgi:hypothetical protein